MAGVRSALIVATYDYQDPGLRELRAPATDAEALARVLGDPDIGAFDVKTVLNEQAHVITRTMEKFFANRDIDDLLLLHYSGHGVKDESGDLYFAAADTEIDYLAATAVAADFVNRLMNRTRARRVVLLLDCCYAGAFERGLSTRGDSGLQLEERLSGRGRAVITASTAMEYAFEGKELTESQEGSPSVFTSALVEGLSTGEADGDQDGMIGLDELYEYVYEAVRRVTPNQTPCKWSLGIQGELYVARRNRPITIPAALPEDLKQAMESSFPAVRAGAVRELGKLLRGRHGGLSLAARHGLEQLTGDDSRSVAASAQAILATFPVQRSPKLQGDQAVSSSEPRSPVPANGPPPERTPLPAPRTGAPPAARPTDVPPPAAPPTDRTQHPPSTPPDETAVPKPAPEPTREPKTVEAREDSARARTRFRLGRRPTIAAVTALVLVIGITAYLMTRGEPSTGTPPAGPALGANQMVVSVGATGSEELEIVAADGALPPTQLATAEHAVLPTLSPDRRTIIYLTAPDDAGLRVARIVGTDGTGDRPLFDSDGPCARSTRPAWNADGTRLAVVCTAADPWQLWVADPDGRRVDQIERVSEPANSPTWAQDEAGDVIVFSQREAGGDPIGLFTVAPEASAEPAPITSTDGADYNADWSDVGGLLYQRSTSTNPVGGTPRVSRSLDDADNADDAFLPEGSLMPAWSSSGTMLAFVYGTGHVLKVAESDGTKPRLVEGVSTPVNSLAWGSR